MEKVSFDLFIELITFDQSLYQIEKEVRNLQAEIELLDQNLHDLHKNLSQEKDRVGQLRKDVDLKEREMQDLDQQEKRVRERLSSVSNEREYQAIKDEINRLKKKQHDYEMILMNSWTSFESAQKEFKAHEAELEEKKQATQESLESKAARLLQAQQRLEVSRQERAVREKEIPSEWLEKYGRMRNSVTNPVVLLEKGSCSACFYKIPAQDALLVARSELIQCKGCYRFLYEREEQDSQEQEE